MRLGDGWLDSYIRTFDDYECPDCGGNHVESKGLHECEDCAGTGVQATEQSRPLPLIMPESWGGSRWRREYWAAFMAWRGDDDCKSCEGDGHLLCETCERAFYDWETGGDYG